MPFADEVRPVAVSDYRVSWPEEFGQLADRLRGVVGHHAVAIDHVGSTSVPGLAAKDCVDVQIRVLALEPLVELLTDAGFRLRPEAWNRAEVSAGVTCPKLVFAPPVGERATNVHVRLHDGPNARYALLFRDYLRAHDDVRDAWGAFKKRLSATVSDIFDYGQIKAPATEVLMAGAEAWVASGGGFGFGGTQH
ncbi:GrpB family protein [Kribbella antibiotica]|uniref:GrpB family protein n=1 Tax=Kribbella antibiotica TaxID=190195 RepID=A0A4R4ZQD9_9ACTN|nr:GrpB family protein [Kribbella antibiotica]TDD61153.1 GrpB family protein [Kribbella antibiotica]